MSGTKNIILILDESGSMYDSHDDVIAMVNNFIYEQQVKNPNAIMSIFLFNDYIRMTCENIAVKNMQPFTDYAPRGPTALYDAVGSVITYYQNVENATVVIVTDGKDTVSNSFTEQKVAHAISVIRRDNGWRFFFFGSNNEILQEAQLIGVDECDTYDEIEQLSRKMSRVVLSL